MYLVSPGRVISTEIELGEVDVGQVAMFGVVPTYGSDERMIGGTLYLQAVAQAAEGRPGDRAEWVVPLRMAMVPPTAAYEDR